MVFETEIEGTHPATELFPLMSNAELDELTADIRKQGLLQEILVYKVDGKTLVLDGRNRIIACRMAGVPLRLVEYTGSDPVGRVLALNIRRRHLSPPQRQALLRQLLKMDPERSNSALAKQTLTDDKTVAKVRDELERSSEIPKITIRRDPRSGKLSRPAVKPDPLTVAQRARIHELKAQGKPREVIAAELGISEWTVRKYLKLPVPSSTPSSSPTSKPVIITPTKGTTPDSEPDSSLLTRPGQQKRSPPGAAERRQRVAELAAQGYTASQIAPMVGLNGVRSAESIRRMAKRFDIPLPAEKFILHQRKVDSNYVVQTAVLAAEVWAEGLDHVKFSELDKGEIPEWITSLEAARKEIGKLIAKLKEAVNGDSN